MTWVTWRQHRSEVLAAALLMVLIILILIFSGQNLFSKLQFGDSTEMRYQYEVVYNPIFISSGCFRWFSAYLSACRL
jgi:hypothetical protein